MTHVCIGLLTIISTGNGLLPGLHQAIFWTNAEKNVNCTLNNKFKVNFNQNFSIVIQENAFESLTCEMVVIFVLVSIC